MGIGLTCQVCAESEAEGVACSGLGPISFAYCRECLDKGAEPEGMFACTAEMCGTDVADFVKGMTTFKDGGYVTWGEWIESDAGKTAITAGELAYG